MEVLKKAKTPDGYRLALYDFEYPDDSSLNRYTVVAFTPSKGTDTVTHGCCGPRMNETYAWDFKPESIEHAEHMIEEMAKGTPPSEFKQYFDGYPEWADFI